MVKFTITSFKQMHTMGYFGNEETEEKIEMEFEHGKCVFINVETSLTGWAEYEVHDKDMKNLGLVKIWRG